jgi:putative spermidine/putrescine transport system ATP-binding protein
MRHSARQRQETQAKVLSPTPPPSAALGTLQRGKPLDLIDITHRFGALKAVDGVSLAVARGEVVALLGPSGCGKTTLLRIVAGFIRQESGQVVVDGARIDALPPNRRNIGIVFQNYALFPHLSVAENVAYGLAARGVSRAAQREAVARLLATVRLTGLADRRPEKLSGGQQQRVALARALAIDPGLLLLDEPFSALDKGLRLDMQIEVKRLQRQFGLTAVMVTHDQDEAMSVADRIAVMQAGRIVQCDTPVAVYDNPANLFVAGFIGSANLFAGRVLDSAGNALRLALDAGAELTLPSASFAAGARVVLATRPEHHVLFASPGPGRVPARLRLAVPLGPDLVFDLETADGATVKVSGPRAGAPDLTPGPVWIGLVDHARPSLFAAPTQGETA